MTQWILLAIFFVCCCLPQSRGMTEREIDDEVARRRRDQDDARPLDPFDMFWSKDTGWRDDGEVEGNSFVKAFEDYREDVR